MFECFDQQRVLAMTDQEKRWLDNVKKAFHDSDCALQSGSAEDHCLAELFKAVDTAKTLRLSLRGDPGENVPRDNNKMRFIEFLGLEIPMARPGASTFQLRERDSGQLRTFTFGEIVYDIRCMVLHENENLNVAEGFEYHILLDWSDPHPAYFAEVRGERFVCNGYFLWNRLREVLAKFITGIEGTIALANNRSFSITIRPQLGAIVPDRRKSDSGPSGRNTRGRT